MPLGTAFETLLPLNNSFMLTVGIVGVGIDSIEGGGYKVFDSHARDMYGNSHSEGTWVLLEIPSMHNYFGGARSKGFAKLGNVSKLTFFDKIGHAKSLGFRFYLAI